VRILVTGGAGFIGSHLVDALVQRREEVVVLDNLKRGRVEHLAHHIEIGAIEFIAGDIRDQERLARTIEGVDLVYHLAAQSNVIGAVQDMDYSFTTNVVGTYNVLKTASSERVRRLVFSSSREVYGDPLEIPVREDAPLAAKNPYGASKLAGEAYGRVWEAAAGLDCMILRFANVYGPRDRDRVIPIWLQRASEGQDLEVYGGSQVLDFIPVAHAVQALLAAATCANDGAVNVGSGRATQILDLGNRIIEAARSGSELRILPPREIEVVRFVADVGRMRNVLGVDPPDDPLGALDTVVPEALQRT
jgi:UDP-glucose 4-epimerase